jgi:CRISPR-associated endonuclease/helicase Cas3
MRVLVEQTRDCCSSWLENLDMLAEDAPSRHPPDKVAVHVIMGGDLEMDWDRWPERDQILIGTQDMLLSRAMNRGYSMSRYRWPVQFGLLNNDCLWVMDEVQLMGNGLATTAQIQAFRRLLRVITPVQSIWMSATVLPQWLETVDFERDADARDSIELSSEDRANPAVSRRLSAAKTVEKAAFPADQKGRSEAALALERHLPGTRTLIIVNRVKRAQEVFEALRKRKTDTEIVLLHSGFRRQDRDHALSRLLASPPEAGIIAVCTQVVEAGVDVSSRLLITDLAPWPSLVQRFGRCNRGGELDGATIVWIDRELDEKGKAAAPYLNEDLENARSKLSTLTDAGPRSLPGVDTTFSPSHVIRRRDVMELFDTTLDLAGADIDVSRYIREGDDHHVHVFWRNLNGKRPDQDMPAPHRDELCPAPVGGVRNFLKMHKAWRWDHLERTWTEFRRLFPGQTVMLDCRDGGYSSDLGWFEKSKERVPLMTITTDPPEGNDDDCHAWQPWQTLVEHSDATVREIERLVSDLSPLPSVFKENLILAARWHDAGKAHEVFQCAIESTERQEVWAKAPSMKHYRRPGFRHELASALAMLEHGLPDLAVYLAAAHHGKVRLSIRSLPHEEVPTDPHARFARGVWHGDRLPSCDLGAGTEISETTLDLTYMDLGHGPKGASWLARMLALRDDVEVGPFRLAFLEALLRVADWRASTTNGGER